MSARLDGCSSFLRVLLTAEKTQAEALLVTASDRQVDCVSEIALNLLKLPLGREAKKMVVKHAKLFKQVADLAASVKKRLVLLQKHAKRIILVLLSVRKRLLALLPVSK